MLLVDTNVLIDVLENDPEWADWSLGQLRAHSRIHKLIINPVIYAELSLAFTTIEKLDQVIDSLGLTMTDIPKPALFLAGKAFLQYRKQGGQKSNVLPDFFIGAHAAVGGYPLLTRDTKRYATYFPSVKLIFPQLEG